MASEEAVEERIENLYRLSVVLPAYNEEGNIGSMLADVISMVETITSDYEIIVVDDGSRDRTASIVAGLAQDHPQIRLIQHQVNRGYGAALYTGFTGSRKDLVFITDSDRQFVLDELNDLLPMMDGADIVAGYRAPRRDPFHRVLFGWGWSMVVALLFGYTARDIDCAFKLFRREIMDHIEIESRGATFSAEFLVRAKRRGYTVREVPVTHRPRLTGSPTGARLDVITRAFRELIRFRLRLWTEGRATTEGIR
ncbi:MAG: glycosyltransferase family 2 protein [Anaerolineae bacterium]